MGSNIPYTYNKISSFDNLKRITRFDLELINGYNDEDFLYNFIYKLDEIIDQQNIIGEAFQQVLNWANNMLQEYTQEQLQQWLDDGTIQEMIQKLVFTFFTYDTIQDVINDTALKENDRVLTYGFNNVGDLGSAKYIISSVPDDFNIKLENNLYANIIAENKMNLHQFGIFGNGETDNTVLFQKAINFVSEKGDSYLFVPSGEYMIDGVDHSKVPSNTGHLLDAGGIKLLTGMTIVHDEEAVIKCIPTNYQQYNIYRLYNVENVTLKGGFIEGDRDEHYGTYGGEWGYGIAISGCNNIHIENMTIEKCWGDGLNLQYLFNEASLTQQQKTCTNIFIKDVISNNNRRQGLSIESAENLLIENCQFINTNGTNPQFGIDIEPANENSTVNNVSINNCIFNGNAGRNLGMYAFNANAKISNIFVNSCYFGSSFTSDKYNVSISDNCDRVIFSNCRMIFNDQSNEAFIFLVNGGNVIVKDSYMLHAKISVVNNTESILNLINNIIDEYNSENFIEANMFKKILVLDNVVNNAKNLFIMLTGATTSLMVVKGNIINNVGNNGGLISIDNSPNIKLIATDNINVGIIGRITWSNYGGTQRIEQYSQKGMMFNAGLRPNDVGVGSTGYDNNTGKYIVYNGTSWTDTNGSPV